MPATFTWSGNTNGLWSDPANWTDVTGAPMSAVSPPTAGDEVTLVGGSTSLRIVNGPGAAETLALDGQVELAGSFSLGTLTQTGVLGVVGSVVAGAGSLGGFVEILGGGMMIGTLTVNGGTLAVDPGAWMEIGSDGTADGSDALVVDFNSSLTGLAATLNIATVLNRGVIAGSFTAGSELGGLNAGVISGISVGAIQNDGTIMTGDGQSIVAHDVSGSGTLAVSSGGTLEIGSAVTNSLAFAGDTGTLVIDADAFDDGDLLSVQGFLGGDIIRIAGGVTDARYVADGWGHGTLTATTALGSVAIELAGVYDMDPTALVQDGTVTVGIDLPLPCFVTGTRILTDRGMVPVEALRIDDRVATVLGATAPSGGFRPIRWIGHRTVREPTEALRPVRIRAGAFGPALPERDLLLSPDHALYAEGALVPVKELVDGDAVASVAVASVTYWHVELDQHDVLLAEGVAAESYLDTGNRTAFANGGPITALHPSFGPLTWEGAGCAPVAVTGPAVEALRTRLRLARTAKGGGDAADGEVLAA